MPEIMLAGCTPVPLAAYLKALGVLRLVAEQKDKSVRGSWRDETFVLDTMLTEEELLHFFLDEYRPSPIISPWNGGSGFYYREGKSHERDPETGKKIKTGTRDEPTAASRTLDLFANAKADRFKRLQAVIVQVRGVLKERGHEQAPADDQKQALVSKLRNSIQDDGLAWFDAALALSGDGLGKPPLLGTGGNDGNLDFSSNYMQRLAELVDLSNGKVLAGGQPSLWGALFGDPTPHLGKGAIGQFSPGAAGGPNAGTGFEREPLINSWDYVLMLEGAVLFASTASRRLEGAGPVGLSYPFTVNTAITDGGSAALIDEKRKSKGKIVGNSFEIWMPLWECPASFAEVRALLSEGRATLGRRSVHDGLDFARAVSSLGVNRGISAFERYAFLQRRGDSISATPQGRIRVRPRPRAWLLNDLDAGNWLSRFRQYARKPDAQGSGFMAPRYVQTLALRLDEAIFAMTQDASHEAVQRVLTAIGGTAAYLASNPKARDPKDGGQKPPPRLRPEWFYAAADGTYEFRIAAALAGLGGAPRATTAANSETQRHEGSDTGEIWKTNEFEDDPSAATGASSAEEQDGRVIPAPPFRAHLAPLKEEVWYRRSSAWGDHGGLVVWSAASLERNLIAILERRLIFTAHRRLEGSPFDGRAPADLTSVLAFLARETFDAKIGGLAQGLAWAEAPRFIHTQTTQTRPIPLAYALLKPFFAPVDHIRAIKGLAKDLRLTIPPGLIARLRAGDTGAAIELASRRARASGLPVTFEPRANDIVDFDGPRLLASLLIPIRARDLMRVMERAYPVLLQDKETSDPKEDPVDAA